MAFTNQNVVTALTKKCEQDVRYSLTTLSGFLTKDELTKFVDSVIVELDKQYSNPELFKQKPDVPVQPA